MARPDAGSCPSGRSVPFAHPARTAQRDPQPADRPVARCRRPATRRPTRGPPDHSPPGPRGARRGVGGVGCPRPKPYTVPRCRRGDAWSVTARPRALGRARSHGGRRMGEPTRGTCAHRVGRGSRRSGARPRWSSRPAGARFSRCPRRRRRARADPIQPRRASPRSGGSARAPRRLCSGAAGRVRPRQRYVQRRPVARHPDAVGV
jgi:hypothetical protein